MTTFERIKKIAKKRKMSLLELNEKAKLGKNVIYGWKTKDPNTESLKKVARVLGVSVDYLLNDVSKNTPDPLSYFRIDTSGLDSNEIDEMKSQLAEYSEYLKSKIQKNHQKKDDNE